METEFIKMFLLSPGDPVSRLREQGKGTRAEAILTNDTQQCRNWWILNGDIVSVEQVPKSQRVHFFLLCVFFFKSAKQRNHKPPSEWAQLTDPHWMWLILGVCSPSPLSLLSSSPLPSTCLRDVKSRIGWCFFGSSRGLSALLASLKFQRCKNPSLLLATKFPYLQLKGDVNNQSPRDLENIKLIGITLQCPGFFPIRIVTGGIP